MIHNEVSIKIYFIYYIISKQQMRVLPNVNLILSKDVELGVRKTSTGRLEGINLILICPDDWLLALPYASILLLAELNSPKPPLIGEYCRSVSLRTRVSRFDIPESPQGTINSFRKIGGILLLTVLLVLLSLILLILLLFRSLLFLLLLLSMVSLLILLMSRFPATAILRGRETPL